MNIEEKLELIAQVGKEIVGLEELRAYLGQKARVIAYDGFEPSGQIHIAQGLLRAINVNKMIRAGVHFKMLVADWHAMANNKLGGNLDQIQTVGKYFIEVWRACGMDLSHVEFIWASELAKNPDYWKLVVQVGKSNALKRFIRTAEMMGREESMEQLTGAHIIYSCMQVADIFTLDARVTQLGMDQRKVNMLAREVGPLLGYWKPVVVSHHMLMGLTKPQHKQEDAISRAIERKMSKSNPDSAIFMTDDPSEVIRKINKAYCLEGDISENPVLEYCKYIIFESFDRLGTSAFIIERPEKWGGTLHFTQYGELERAFAEKKLHPQDLKQATAGYINQLLSPVRKHFEEDEVAAELLRLVKTYQITR